MKVRQVFAIAVAAMLALSSAALAKDRSRPAEPVTSPAGWFPMTSYPAAAKRAGQQGRVVVTLTIDKSGAPAACQVVGSSGVASLDTATCDLAMANAKFSPARDAVGRPVETTYTLPGVRWELRDPPPIKLAGPWRAAATVAIDEQGKVLSCKDERRGPVPEDVSLCVQAGLMPPAFGLFARNYSTEAKPIDIVMETAATLDGGEALATQYDTGSRETVMVVRVHFEVGADGKASNCQVLVQSGPPVFHLCEHPPTFLPIAKPQGVTVVSAISRPAVE